MFFIFLLGVPALLCLLILTLAWGIQLIMRSGPQRSIGGALLGMAVALFIVLYGVMATSPAFDFIDRCGPNGVGGCGNGEQTPEQVRAEIRRDLFVSVLQCVVVPSAIGVSLVLFKLRRKDKAQRQIGDVTTSPSASLD